MSRYDTLTEVVTGGGAKGLHDLLNVSLRVVGGIKASEMFVVMDSRSRATVLPAVLRCSWSAGAPEDG